MRKKNGMKRLLSLALALLLVLSYVPVSGMAEDGCAHHSHDETCGYNESGSCSFVCDACAAEKAAAEKAAAEKAAESQPVESQPAESQPAESQPAESQPAESQPAESQPVETKPLQTQQVKATAKRGIMAAQDDYYYTPGVTYLRLRIDGAAAQDNDACLVVRNGSGQLVEVRNGDVLENRGLYRGKSYTVVRIDSTSGNKHYELTSNGQTLSIPSSGYHGGEECLYYTFTMEKLYVTVKDSLGNLKANHPVHLDGRTVNTGSNGVADFGYVRRIYQMAPYIEYTKWDGTTGTVTAQRNSIQNAGSNWTLTIPVTKMATIRVHNSTLQTDISNATVLVDGKAATHDTDGYYKILLDRTAATQTYNFSISAPGYQSYSGSMNLTDDMLDGVLPFELQLAPVTIRSGGEALGSSVTLETGHSYDWTVDLPDGATLVNSSAANLQITQTGSGWTVTPLSAASAQNVTFGYSLKGTEYKKSVSITVNKGTVAAPGAPSVSGGDVDISSLTVTVPKSIHLKTATVTVTGGVDNISKHITFSDPASENVKTVTFDGALRGNVTFSYNYESDTVNYTGASGSFQRTYYKLVDAPPTFSQSVFPYTGQPVRPTASSGEHIKSYKYGLITSSNGVGLTVETNDLSKLTVDNDITQEFIPGFGATEFQDCPYYVMVTLEDYFIFSSEKLFDSYPNTYFHYYTVVPRNITVKAQDQTIYLDESLDQSKYTIESGSLLEGHNMRVTLSGDTATAGTGKEISVAAVISGGNGKYYNITTAPGTLTVKYNPDSITAECPAELTYDGTDRKPVTVKYNDTLLTEGADYTVTYQNNRNAGTATYSVTGITFDKTLEGSFTIGKKALTAGDFTFAPPASLTYDGTEKHASVASDLVGVGNVTVKHSGTPKNAGAYTVSIDVTEGSNYLAAADLTQDGWRFTIEEATPQIQWSTNKYTYNRAPQGEATVTMAGGEDCTVTYSYVLDGSAVDGLPTDAGTYTVTATVIKQPNYREASSSVTLQILPKEITPALQITPEFLIHDGSEKTCTVTVKDGDAVIPENEYTVSYADNTAVGAATVTVADKTGGNYTVSTATATFLILPDDSPLEGITEDNVTSANGAAIDSIGAAMSGMDIRNAGADAQAQWEALEERCLDLADRLAEVAAAARQITEDTAALTDVKTSDLDEIQALQALYEDIEANLTVEEQQELADELETLAALAAAIGEANDALAALKTAVETLAAKELVFADKAAIKALQEDAAVLAENTYLTDGQQDQLQELADALDALLEEFAAAEAVEALLKAMPTYAQPDDAGAIGKYTAAKKAYTELSDADKERVDPTAVARLAKLKKALTDYTIIKGDKSKWVKGSNTGLSFTADGYFGHFISVEVDGTLLRSDQYDAEAGSTKIYLNTHLLRKLKSGNHIIAIYYGGEFEGVAVGTFRVQSSASSPATGDNSNIVLLRGIALSSALALAALYVYGKKRKMI